MIDSDFRPPDTELAAALEYYQSLFSILLSSRGIIPETVTSIKERDCKIVLEAESDEDDGAIDVPHNLSDLINEIYSLSPIDPLFFKRVLLTDSAAMFEYKLGKFDGDWCEDGDFIFNKIVSPGLAINRQLYFDLKRGSIAVGIRYTHEPIYYEKAGGYEDSTVWASRKLPGQIAQDFAPFLQDVEGRLNSRISIYRGSEDDLF